MAATSFNEREFTFNQLLRLGQSAHAEGNQTLAHEYLRRAALLDPYNENVWMALYQVVDQLDDQFVCLQNVLAINPNNREAQRLLRELEQAWAFEPVHYASQPISDWAVLRRYLIAAFVGSSAATAVASLWWLLLGRG